MQKLNQISAEHAALLDEAQRQQQAEAQAEAVLRDKAARIHAELVARAQDRAAFLAQVGEAATEFMGPMPAGPALFYEMTPAEVRLAEFEGAKRDIVPSIEAIYTALKSASKIQEALPKLETDRRNPNLTWNEQLGSSLSGVAGGASWELSKDWAPVAGKLADLILFAGGLIDAIEHLRLMLTQREINRLATAVIGAAKRAAAFQNEQGVLI